MSRPLIDTPQQPPDGLRNAQASGQRGSSYRHAGVRGNERPALRVVKPIAAFPATCFLADLRGEDAANSARRLGDRENVMRGLALFAAGTLVGIAATAGAQNTSPNHGVVGLNHVAISVPDIDKAVEYYTKTLGFPEAFRIKNQQGQVQLVYVQISKGTFIELQPSNPQRPPGLNHFGVVVDNMAQATAMWKERGANVGPTNLSGTKAILSNIVDPNGVRMELAELPPESLHYQAMERWK
jgi:catechol 2,3-dioxygenase-like lactoylglutathione lyase family enzyme